MPGPSDGSVRTTGGQVDELVVALIDAAYDKDPNVQRSIHEALHNLGKKQPALVLSSCLAYLTKHNKLSQGHRVAILNGMEAVILDSGTDVDADLAKEITEQGLIELTGTKEVVPDWQTAASGVLVAMGTVHCNIVMEQMLANFPPGVLPHFFIVQTMANLALANVFGMVPFLKSILGQLLPILGMAKHDNMKWVLATAFAKFCEAILDYIANIEKAPDPSVKKEAFSTEVDPAFDMLFQQWLSSREAKLRLAVVEALGNMSQIMSRDRLEEQMPKLLPAVLGLYKKHSEAFHITQSLCMLLESCSIEGSPALDVQFESLVNSLFPQICIPVDFANPMTVKNHNELLRCFSVLVKLFPNKLLQFLLQKLEPTNEKSRLGVLAIVRHLINSSGSHLEEKQDLILSGMKLALGDPSNKVKKALAQTIIAMAHHGYLELEGGQIMLEFIITQCALGPEPPGFKRPSDPEYVSNDALRLMCENVLQLLSTTVENMDGVLWPYILEYLVPETYTGAIPVLCKCVHTVAKRLREEKAEDFVINFDQFVNVPKPCAIISRLLVLAGRPYGARDRGQHALLALQLLGPTLNEGLVELWDAVIPKLLAYLEEQEEKDEEEWSQKTWEDLMLKMVTKSIDQCGDEEWVEELANAMGEQVALYNNKPEEKNFLYKCLGVILKKSGKKDVVQKHLGSIFDTVKHLNKLEREGCAVGIGFVASAHLDSVITKLDTVHKLDTSKKSSSLFSFIKDIGKADVDEFTKSTVMLCYGYSTLYAPTDLITSRLEAIIVRNILPQFLSVREISVKQSLIVTADLIGQAMHPDHLQTKHAFTNRPDFLMHMQNYLRAENTGNLCDETRKLALLTCATLIKLDPKLSSAEQLEMVKTGLDAVLSLPPGGVGLKKKEEKYESVADQEELMEETFAALEELIKQILLKDLSSNTLNTILQQLYPWSVSEAEVERHRAMTLWLHSLRLYLDNVQIHTGRELNFSVLGESLGRIVPRCTDPAVDIRQTSVSAVHVALRVAMLYAGHTRDTADAMIDALAKLQDRVKKTDANVMFSVCSDLAKVIAKKLPSDQVLAFFTALYPGLTDKQDQSASGACVVLNGMVKARGGELHGHIEAVLKELHRQLPLIENAQTKQGTLRAIRTLTSHHMLVLMGSLLSYTLPLEGNTIEVWQVLGQDPQLLASILEHLLEHLSRSLPYEEKSLGENATQRTATLMPVTCTCVILELLRVEESKEPVKVVYPRLLAALMVRVASSIDNKPPRTTAPKEDAASKDKKSSSSGVSREVKISPNGVAVDALKQLFVRLQHDALMTACEDQGIWDMLTTEEQYPEGFTLLAKLLIEHDPQVVSSLVSALTPSLSTIYDPQRVMVVSFFAQLIKDKCAGDLALVDTLVHSLLTKLVDSCHHVRRYCIRGLANVADVGHAQVQKFSTTVLSAMMAGMDDKEDLEDDITLEAMNGLSRILDNVNETDVRGILINIALRIRPCFEKDRVAVRCAAFALFGHLARFGDGPSREPFLEQVHTNLVSLLLHLNDPEPDVRKACKQALRALGPLLGSENVNSMFQRHLLETASLHYGEFMNDLSKAIVADFSEKLNFYVMGNVQFFKSHWSEIKGNAVLFAGFLLGNMTAESYTGISQEHVCGSMVMLLKDNNVDVRRKAAEAMSLLHNF